MAESSPWRHRALVDLGTVGLAVYDTGPVGQRPLLLAHGMSWDHRQFDGLAAALVVGGLRVVAYDARGTGGSSRPLPAPADHTLPRQVDDCRALLASLDGPPPVIGGVSMGAAVTLEVARTSAPGVVAGVIQVAPGVGPDGPASETTGYLRWIAAALQSGGWDGLVEAIRSSDQPPDDVDEQVRFAREWRERFDADTLLALFEGFCDSAIISPEPVISQPIPAAVVAWPGDALHPVSFAEHATAVLGPAAELVLTEPPASGDLPVAPVADAIHRLLRRT